MLASAGVFRLARTGCWSTGALLLASRFAWYTDGASSEPAVASSWAPIGADGPWRPSDEATLTASSFSAEAETVPLGLPAPPTPPGAHASAGGPVATVSPCSLVPDTVPEHTRPVVAPHTGPTVTRNRTMSFPSSPKSSTRSSPPPRSPSPREGYHRISSRSLSCLFLLSLGRTSGCPLPVLLLLSLRFFSRRHHTHTRARKNPTNMHCTRSHFTGSARVFSSFLFSLASLRLASPRLASSRLVPFRSVPVSSRLVSADLRKREYETRPSRLLT